MAIRCREYAASPINTLNAQRISIQSPLELVAFSKTASNMFPSPEEAKRGVEEGHNHGKNTFSWRFGGIPFQRKEVCDVVRQKEAGNSHKARRFTY